MALITCAECSAQVSDKAAACPSCGYPIAAPGSAASPSESAPPPVTTVSLAKSRGAYIMLGLMFGGFGFHNFYSGHYGVGATKLGLFMVAFFMDAVTGFNTGFSVLVFVVTVFWSLIELFVVTEDATGTKMH